MPFSSSFKNPCNRKLTEVYSTPGTVLGTGGLSPRLFLCAGAYFLASREADIKQLILRLIVSLGLW